MAEKALTTQKNNKRPKAYPPGADGKLLDVASGIGRAKWITAILLAVCVVLCVVFAGDELSVYNVQYLLKHFDVNSEGNSGNFTTLNYESDATYAFGYYKDDFVIVNSSDIDYYDMKGNSVMSNNIFMSDPQVITTEKYLFVYDQGNVSYSVYDSFFNVKSDVTDYPIRYLAASDEGSYAIVTRDIEYRGAVLVYDKSFNLKNEIYKDKLVFSAAFASDGSRLAILSAETSERGEFYTEIQSVVPGKGEAEFTKVIEDCFPVSAGYFDNGRLGVLCQDRFIVFDKDGEQVGEYLFYDSVPTACAFNGGNAVVSFSENVIGVESLLKVFDDGASVKSEAIIDGQVKKIIVDETYAYTLLTDAVARTSLSDGFSAYEYTESNPLDVLVRDEGSLLLCYGNHVDSVQYAFTGVNEEE